MKAIALAWDDVPREETPAARYSDWIPRGGDRAAIGDGAIDLVAVSPSSELPRCRLVTIVSHCLPASREEEED